MAKNRLAKKKEVEETPEFDGIDNFFDNEYDELAVEGMMECIIESHKHHQNLALELSKMIVANSSNKMDEEKILSLYKKSLNTVLECSPVHNLYKKCS